MKWKNFGKIALMVLTVAFVAQAGMRLWWPPPEKALASTPYECVLNWEGVEGGCADASINSVIAEYCDEFGVTIQPHVYTMEFNRVENEVRSVWKTYLPNPTTVPADYIKFTAYSETFDFEADNGSVHEAMDELPQGMIHPSD